MKVTMIALAACLLWIACSTDSPDDGKPTVTGAEYVLPYPVGKTYTCSQGFNGALSHTGTFTYAVDFGMAVGTPVTVARSGRVVHVLESYSDDDQIPGHENVVIIMHEDSTYARYVHLTLNGALVLVNQSVAPGDTLGLSGSSGTNGGPHLHFDVTRTFGGRSDQTIPFDFRNTRPHPVGLQRGVAYQALPY
jgi:murein DD-endopeptidase MepM/ murein hydrolase activator NlpD